MKESGNQVVANRFNRVIRPSDFDSEEFQEHVRIASGRSTFPRHRKFWEWGMGFQALLELGYLDRSNVALGLGVGLEPFPYILSRYLEHVYRTDFINEDNPWMRDYATKIRAESGKPSFLPKSISCEPDRVSFLNADATDLHQFEDGSIDIVFSFSSIEHFGNRIKSPPHGSARCMQECERVLRPGGVCLGATELLLTDKKHHQFFQKNDFIEEVIRSHNMEPVEDFDFELDPALCNTKYYFPALLRGVFKDQILYQEEIMGFIVGDAVVVSIFFVFTKDSK